MPRLKRVLALKGGESEVAEVSKFLYTELCILPRFLAVLPSSPLGARCR